MKLIVGLGNPGSRYAQTRHNIGFRVADALADRWNAQPTKKVFKAEARMATFEGEAVLILKPQTFMNLSGESVQAAIQFHKIDLKDVIVIHDEMDLMPLTIKLKSAGGPGGHNGLKSIDQCLSQSSYHRVRMGVGHPSKLNLPHDPADYVLSGFSADEEAHVSDWTSRAVLAIEKILQDGPQKAMTEFNKKE